LDFETRPGTYVSADTGLPLFRSEDKYDSGTGWPSFVKPISTSSIILKEDDSLGVPRTEVLTADTHAHLGHVFDDGPVDRGGKRYCMNGVALRFIPDAPVQ
jgi:methionine-R-sulfoxide reductase